MIGESLLVNLLNRLAKPASARPGPGLQIGHHQDAHGRRVPAVLPLSTRAEHTLVLGKTGSGKTHFLQVVADELMARGEGFVLFDFHGDCVAAVTALAARHPLAAERLVLIDPTDPARSPGLNPLELRGNEAHEAFGRAAELAAILRARWHVDAFGPRSEELLRNTLFTLAVNRLTLVEAPLLLSSAAFRATLTANLPSPDVRHYWQERFEPLSEAMKATFREPILNKITGFLVEPACRHLLGQVVSTVDFGSAMQEGRWILVNLSRGALREHARTLGNLVFAKLQFEVFARVRLPPARRRMFSVIVDEVQNLAENDLITLLSEGRKFQVGLLTANQYWEQLPKSLRGALLATGTQVFFRLSHADASVLSSELSSRRGQHLLASLTTLSRGHALMRIGGSDAVQVTVSPLPRVDVAGHHAAQRLQALSVHQYARSREAVERDISTRAQVTLPPHRHAHNNPRPHPSEGQDSW